MTFQCSRRRSFENTPHCAASGSRRVRAASRPRTCTVGLAILVGTLALVAANDPAAAWWRGRPSGVAPWVMYPFQRPHPEYRYSVPPGAQLSFDDPNSGTTYCWSQHTGFYFVCGFVPPVVFTAAPTAPPPGGVAGEVPAPSGVLMFRLPQGAQASIDGVPIGLSDGFGIHALAPGSHRVVLSVAGKESAHTVNVRSHKIFTVTPAGIVASEP